MNKKVMDAIDECAIRFYETRDKQHFEKFASYATPIIKMHVAHTCTGSTKWDPDELFSILFADMWRLFKVYVPEENRKFHWLMLRQLKNKTINYINNCTQRIYRTCFICAESQEKGNTVCCKCGAPLTRPHATTGIDHYDAQYSHTPDYLKDVENKQLVDIVLEETARTSPTTHKILTMLLEGYTKSEISRELSIAQNALNNRIRKCETILLRIRG